MQRDALVCVFCFLKNDFPRNQGGGVLAPLYTESPVRESSLL